MTTITNATAADLVARSISHDEIADAIYTDDLHASLVAKCDDWTDVDTYNDYWGSENGQEWRVKLTIGDEDRRSTR